MAQPAWVKGRLGSEPFLSRLFYGLIVKRSSTYMTFVMVTATGVGIGYDYFMDGIWNMVNKGVRAAPARHPFASARARARHPLASARAGPDAAVRRATWQKLWKDIKDGYQEEE